MKFVVGLGNPGKRYQRTPHNVGFEVVDRLARPLGGGAGGRFRKRFKAEYLEGSCDGEKVYLVKPVTYMNLSGPAVRDLLGYFRGTPEDLLVVHDDIDLPLGRLRFRAGGSSGGHLGIASVIEALGRDDFARLKIGVGRGAETTEGATRDPAAHVLSPFGGEVGEQAAAVIGRAAEAAEFWLREGFEPSARRYN